MTLAWPRFPVPIGLWSHWVPVTIAAITVISSDAPKASLRLSLLTVSVREIRVLRKEAQICFLPCLSAWRKHPCSFKCLINGLDYPLQENMWLSTVIWGLLESLLNASKSFSSLFSSLPWWHKVFWDTKTLVQCSLHSVKSWSVWEGGGNDWDWGPAEKFYGVCSVLTVLLVKRSLLPIHSTFAYSADKC